MYNCSKEKQNTSNIGNACCFFIDNVRWYDKNHRFFLVLDIPEEYLEYNSRVQAYNAQCFNMLSYAYRFNDKALANLIVSNMSSSLTYQSMGDWNVVVEKRNDSRSAFDAYMVKTNNDEIEEAKQQIKNYFSK